MFLKSAYGGNILIRVSGNWKKLGAGQFVRHQLISLSQTSPPDVCRLYLGYEPDINKNLFVAIGM